MKLLDLIEATRASRRPRISSIKGGSRCSIGTGSCRRSQHSSGARVRHVNGLDYRSVTTDTCVGLNGRESGLIQSRQVGDANLRGTVLARSRLRLGAPRAVAGWRCAAGGSTTSKKCAPLGGQLLFACRVLTASIDRSRATRHLIKVVQLVRLLAKVVIEAPEIILRSSSCVRALLIPQLRLGRLNSFLRFHGVQDIVEQIVSVVLLAVSTSGLFAEL